MSLLDLLYFPALTRRLRLRPPHSHLLALAFARVRRRTKRHPEIAAARGSLRPACIRWLPDGGGRRYPVLTRRGGAGMHDRSLPDTRFFRAPTATTASSFAPVVPCGPARIPILTVRQPPEHRARLMDRYRPVPVVLSFICGAGGREGGKPTSRRPPSGQRETGMPLRQVVRRRICGTVADL